jgi:hypothetical protein
MRKGKMSQINLHLNFVSLRTSLSCYKKKYKRIVAYDRSSSVILFALSILFSFSCCVLGGVKLKFAHDNTASVYASSPSP